MKAAVLLISIFCGNVTIAQTLPLLGQLEKGEHAVGFHHEEISDYSRSFDLKTQYRPIELAVWYPATEDVYNQKMRYKDYVELFQSNPDEAIDAFKKSPLTYDASDSLLNVILNSYTCAVQKVVPTEGAHPLILFAPGIQEHSYSNALLGEILASHGYIVASASYRDTYSDDVIDGPGNIIETAIRDMEFVLGHMRNFKHVDFENIGLMGHSAGGSAALLMALRNFNIDALAILDGSFIANHGIDALTEFPYFDSKYLHIPYLHFISGYWRKNGDYVSDFNNKFFDGIQRSDAYMVDMLDLFHHSLVSDMHLRYDNSGVDYEQQGFKVSEAKSDKSYKVVADILLTYFNHYLKHEKLDFPAELRKIQTTYPDILELELKD